MHEYTIDELARQARMTVRNVRAYQSRGLLPSATLRGRTGFYGEQHLDRLNTIRSLQRSGWSLEKISALIQKAPSARSGRLLALARAASASVSQVEPVVLSRATATRLCGDPPTAELITRFERLGHVVRLDDDHWEISSPQLYDAILELTRLGVPATELAAVTETLYEHLTAIAASFVTLFADHIAERPHVGDMTEDAVDELVALAGRSVVAAFGIAMQSAVATTVDANEARDLS